MLSLLVGCAVSPPQTLPTAASATQLVAPAQVDATIVTGLSSKSEENLAGQAHSYVNLPAIPGAGGWSDSLHAQIDPQLSSYSQKAKSLTGSSDFSVNWQLMAASPKVIGIRLVTEVALAGSASTSRESTSWWDPATSAAHPARDLIATTKESTFFDRLKAAGQNTKGVDHAAFTKLLEQKWGGFPSIGFTADGRLWVEYETSAVTADASPVGLTIDASGLLSALGEQAKSASLNPQDPGLATASPSATPTTTRPSTATATPTGSPSTPSTKPAARVNCKKLKCIALTFDDGPVSGTTQLLDVLKAKHVHATFFMVGSNAAQHPAIIKRMVAEGHVIGNHSWSHPQLTKLSDAAIRSQLTRTNAAITKAGAPQPTLLRPPYGSTNATVRKIAKSLGMAQILWSVDPLDWKDRNSKIVTERVVKQARRGSIVLSHDIHGTTRAAYAGIIDQLRAKGFTFVTVPQLLGNKLVPGSSHSSAR